MASEIAVYQLDDSSVVRFEIDRTAGFQPASSGSRTAARVRDAIGPAVQAAKEVLDRLKEAAPDEVEVAFGVKVSGGTDWLVARAASEANFEVRLTWRPAQRGAAVADAEITAAGAESADS